ncbi:ABC transporter ATP-binding protein [Amycolatopsis magusensis]|uniref:ABC transporter ATP-binding protein n=1 Tax=Amycolatopsis magusensis TaxID=882444 RepID=UPI0037AD52AD
MRPVLAGIDAVRHLSTLAQVLRRHSPRRAAVVVLAAVVSGLLTTATMVAAGWLLGSTTDLISDPGAARPVYLALVWFIALITLSGLTACLLEPLSLAVRQDLVAGALDDVTHVATTIELSSADDPDTAAVLGDAGRTLRDWMVLAGLHSMWGVLAGRVAAVGSMVIVGVWFWLAPLVLVGSWLWLGREFARWSVDIGETAGGESLGLRRADYYRRLLVGTESAKEVRLFGLQQFFADRFHRAWQAAMLGIWARRHDASRSVLIAVAGVAAANAAVLGLLAWQAAAGTTPVGQVAATTMAILGLAAFGVQDDNDLWSRRARAVLVRFDLARRALGPDRAEHLAHSAAVPGPVLALEGVTFAYPGSAEPVLAEFNLHVAAGQTVAIVGRNGSGKSTLMKLVCGLYAPCCGDIRVKGVQATEARNRHPGTVSVVFQDFARFPLSLFDNVRLAFPGACDAEVHAAIDRAGLHELAGRLPYGVQTILSSAYEHGQDLSGGQWQRVALARACLAVIRGAELIILDEPTAALDVDAERDFVRQFLEVTRQCTTLVVTHRLASVRELDRIVLIEHGRVAEDGRHDELMAAGGTYCRMFGLQARRYSQPDAER